MEGEETWRVSTDELGESVVTVKDGKIIEVWGGRCHKFKYQPFTNLCNWLAKKFPESFDIEHVK